MSRLSNFPPEVLQQVLIRTRPDDVAAFSATSQSAHGLVNGLGGSLWRGLDLENFDDPRLNPIATSDEELARIDWEERVKNRSRAKQRPLDHVDDLAFMMEEAAPRDDTEGSKNVEWLMSLLGKHPTIDTPLTSYADLESRSNMLSRLLSAPGFLQQAQIYEETTLSKSLRVRAYDPSQIERHTLFGPFEYVEDLHHLNQASQGPEVNWVQVEACIRSLSRQLFWMTNAARRQRWTWVIRPPRELSTIRAYSAPGCIGRRGTRDWAGVEGRWVRVTSLLDFMDQQDFWDVIDAYLDDPTEPSPENHIPEEHVAYAESQIWIVDKAPDELPEDPFSFCYHPSFPPIYIAGTSRWEDSRGAEEGGGDGPLDLRGRIVMYRNKTVRWTVELLLPIRDPVTKQITETQVEWVMQGVPVGHPCAAAAGIAGSWHNHGHRASEGNPVGPFWMWKVPDDAPRVFS